MFNLRQPLATRLIALISLGLAGCDPPLDAEGQALLATADEVTLALDAASGSALAFTRLDFSRRPDAAAIDRAATVINGVFGGCMRATALAEPAPGLAIDFDERGCGLPLTTLLFRGSLAVRFPRHGESSGLAIAARRLRLLGVELDGELALESRGGGSFAGRFDHLRARISGHDATLDGDFVYTVGGAGNESTFDGAGTVSYDGAALGFVARDVHRNFIGDCYPDRGTITIRAAKPPLPAAELSIRFQGDEVTGLDSDDSGTVHVDWQGRTTRRSLGRRACTSF